MTCHSRARGNPLISTAFWIPAFAGMTSLSASEYTLVLPGVSAWQWLESKDASGRDTRRHTYCDGRLSL